MISRVGWGLEWIGRQIRRYKPFGSARGQFVPEVAGESVKKNFKEDEGACPY